MRFWPSRKHITTIEELLGVVYENQSIFKQLETLEIAFKKERVNNYLNQNNKPDKREVVSKQIVTGFLSNAYMLEHLHVTIPIKKYALKQVSKKDLEILEQGKTVEFSMQCEPINKTTVSLFLAHHRRDTPEDVLDYTKAYTNCFLEKKLSLWQKLWIQIKRVLRLERELQ